MARSLEEPITIEQLADHRLGREALTGQDYADAGLPMLGGCAGCSASVACYNSCPSKDGYIRCMDCIGDQGFDTVEAANEVIFGEDALNAE